VAERIARLEQDAAGMNDAVAEEIQGLRALDQALAQITPPHYSKYQALVGLLESKAYGWNRRAADDRLVIFSERLETLNFLQDQLSTDLKLKPKQITQLHGGMSDIEQQQVVEAFGNPDSPLRVLLCSDVASEGIDLHYQCHRLIHFDMPWSLMVFQQRNGRIDRYGQEREPRIDYLVKQDMMLPVFRAAGTSGEIRLPDTTIAVEPGRVWGTKDRSWGIRPVGDPAPPGAPRQHKGLKFFWAPLHWDDHITHMGVFEDADGHPARWLKDEGTLYVHRLTEGRYHLRFAAVAAV